MSVGTGDINALFNQLKSGLARAAGGMSIGVLVVHAGPRGRAGAGVPRSQAGQAQNRFYNELEDWLAAATRLSSGALGGDGEGSMPAYVQALLEQSAENMEELQRTLARGEEGRAETSARR